MNVLEEGAVLGPVPEVACRQHTEHPCKWTVCSGRMQHVKELGELGHLLGFGYHGDNEVICLSERGQAAIQSRWRVHECPGTTSRCLRNDPVLRQTKAPREHPLRASE